MSREHYTGIRAGMANHKIYNTWKRIQDREGTEFEEFPAFRKWAMEHGGAEMDSRLARKNRFLPPTADNLLFYRGTVRYRKDGTAVIYPPADQEPEEERSDGEIKQSIKRFDKTVAEARKAHGMPPLEGSTYEDTW